MTFLGIPLASGILALIFVVFLAIGVRRKPEGGEVMQRIAGEIRKGSKAFLRREYTTVGAIVIILGGGIALTGLGWRTGASFALGAAVSALAGYIGMSIATRANSRTTEAAKSDVKSALGVAVSGGAVMGLSVVGLSLLGLGAVIYLFAPNLWSGTDVSSSVLVAETGVINGFAMGASLMALFARAGGGIFTKGADMAADLVGKVEAGIPEDDPRNPAVIADNVGDNVGDVAGLGADLLESYVESIIASMALAAAIAVTGAGRNLILLPLAIAAVGVVGSIIGIFLQSSSGAATPRRH